MLCLQTPFFHKFIPGQLFFHLPSLARFPPASDFPCSPPCPIGVMGMPFLGPGRSGGESSPFLFVRGRSVERDRFTPPSSGMGDPPFLVLVSFFFHGAWSSGPPSRHPGSVACFFWRVLCPRVLLGLFLSSRPLCSAGAPLPPSPYTAFQQGLVSWLGGSPPKYASPA